MDKRCLEVICKKMTKIVPKKMTRVLFVPQKANHKNKKARAFLEIFGNIFGLEY